MVRRSVLAGKIQTRLHYYASRQIIMHIGHVFISAVVAAESGVESQGPDAERE
jgi:hypothetical protein